MIMLWKNTVEVGIQLEKKTPQLIVVVLRDFELDQEPISRNKGVS